MDSGAAGPELLNSVSRKRGVTRASRGRRGERALRVKMRRLVRQFWETGQRWVNHNNGRASAYHHAAVEVLARLEEQWPV
jgi:hypothetical protein